jgi:uncharacterized protein YegP (UPF0339 family)
VAAKFEITKAKDGEFHFHLKASNGDIILTSQMYAAKSSAKNGIASVKKNAADDNRYERKETHNGHHMFNVRAANHEVIGTSQGYVSHESREKGIASVKKNAAEAAIHDLTTGLKAVTQSA